MQRRIKCALAVAAVVGWAASLALAGLMLTPALIVAVGVASTASAGVLVNAAVTSSVTWSHGYHVGRATGRAEMSDDIAA